MTDPPAARLNKLLTIVASAVLLCSAVLGVVRAIEAHRGEPDAAANDQRGRFFAAARGLAPRGARVLALTTLVPAPDFDFWFPASRPCELLVKFDPARMKPAGENASISPERIPALLQQLGVLFTPEAFAAARSRVPFVITTARDEFPEIPREWRVLAADGNCAFYSIQ